MSNDVLVVTSSETLSLRLRSIVEGEGGCAVIPVDPGEIMAAATDKSMRLLLTDGRPPGLDAETLLAGWRSAAEGKPVVLIGVGASSEDVTVVAPGAWEVVRIEVKRLLTPPTDEAAAFAGAFNQASIIIVDDSVTYREYLRNAFASEGADVRTTGNVTEVAALIEQHPPDCILIDLVMPGMGGANLCRQIAALRRRRALRFYIVVMSSREGETDLIHSLSAGADDFLGKSQNTTVIKGKLRALLRRKFMIDRFLC